MIGTEIAQVKQKGLSWMAMTLLLTNFGLLLGIVLAWYWFGSVGSALAYLKGDRLIADRYSVSFGEAEQGQRPVVTFGVKNTSNRKITIVGAKTLCTCIFAENLPLSIPPRNRCSIRVAVKTASRDGPIHESIDLYTDFPEQPKLELVVLGRVSTRSGEQAGETGSE